MLKRRIIWLALLVLSLVSISYYGGTISYGFFFAVVGVPVISVVYIIMVMVRFRIYQEIESRDLICREPMPYRFILQNEDHFSFASVQIHLFPNFSYVENMSETIEYELQPGDRCNNETRLVCKYRGEYEVGVKEIVVTDFFRLFSFTYEIPSTIKALVSPHILILDRLKSLEESVYLSTRENPYRKEDADIVVRDYQNGDPLRMIQWKATARTGELKVRNFHGEEKQGIALYFDSGRYSPKQAIYLPLENQIIETAVAVVHFFATRHNELSVAYHQANDFVWSRIHNLPEFDVLYSNLSALHFNDSDCFANYYQEYLNHIGQSNYKVAIFILHEMTDEMREEMILLSRKGMQIIVYLITDETKQINNSERFTVYQISTSTDLAEVL